MFSTIPEVRDGSVCRHTALDESSMIDVEKKRGDKMGKRTLGSN